MEHIQDWTLPLGPEGSEELLEERETRPAETPQRLAMLARVRDAVRALKEGGTRSLLPGR
ncbi:MAG TPA: hypothetical protein VFY16_13900 [Gemmatimonadaceae bacterium]|nr:hypothetical protein [Gemmatimonadaceae bacterium]